MVVPSALRDNEQIEDNTRQAAAAAGDAFQDEPEATACPAGDDAELIHSGTSPGRSNPTQRRLTFLAQPEREEEALAQQQQQQPPQTTTTMNHAPVVAQQQEWPCALQQSALRQTVLADEEEDDIAMLKEKKMLNALPASSGSVPASRGPARPGAVSIPGIGATTSSIASDDLEAQEEEGEHFNCEEHEQEESPSPRPAEEEAAAAAATTTTTAATTGGDSLIQAYTVEDSMDQIKATVRAEVEEEMRQQFMQDTVQATNVLTSDELRDHNKKKRKRRLALLLGGGGGCLLLIVVIVLVVVLLSPSSNTSRNIETPPLAGGTKSTLDTVRKRGYVICGSYADGRYGFNTPNLLTGELEGINVDQCQAISLAIFGTPHNVELKLVDPAQRFMFLANGTVDVLATTITHTMERDIYLRQTRSGFTFSTPYVYSGLTFWGRPGYLDCAESLDAQTGICQNLTICVPAFSSHEYWLRSILPQQVIVQSSSPVDVLQKLEDETCRVAAGEIFFTNALVNNQDHQGMSGTKLLSKDPLCLVTRENDAEFSSLVELIVNVFYLAESHGISRTNAQELSPLVGPELAPMLIPVIAELGNYRDLYNRHLESIVPRAGLNNLYTSGDTTGLLYSFPFGLLANKGPDPLPNSRIANIQKRGFVRCGYLDKRDLELATFDLQFCKALSAALFGGSTEALEVKMMPSTPAAYQALLDGDSDVVAGMRLPLVSRYKEPTTGTGFSLSKPYYYDITAMEAYGFATTAVDVQWSDFVTWVIMALIYAEEEGIDQNTANEMPQVYPFGPKMASMFQDLVGSMGSYEDIYNRTLEATIPRAGSGNELNFEFSGPQQFAIPFQ